MVGWAILVIVLFVIQYTIAVFVAGHMYVPRIKYRTHEFVESLRPPAPPPQIIVKQVLALPNPERKTKEQIREEKLERLKLRKEELSSALDDPSERKIVREEIDRKIIDLLDDMLDDD